MTRRKVAVVLIALVTLAGPTRVGATPSGTCPKWEPLLRKHFPAKVVPVMSRIAFRESRCNEKALSAVRVTGYPDLGVWQIQGSWKSVTLAVCRPKDGDHIRALLSASCNVRVARYLYDHGGLAHWRGTSGK